MEAKNVTYPTFSTNPNRKRTSFWNGMGMGVGSPKEVSQIADTLFHAPVVRYEDDGLVVNRHGSGQEAEGRISLAAARRLLGNNISEEDDVVVRMLEAGSSPEHVETYDATFEVVELSEKEREAIPQRVADPLMLEEIPDDFQYGQNYDFTVIDAGSEDYLVAESGVAEDLSDYR